MSTFEERLTELKAQSPTYVLFKIEGLQYLIERLEAGHKQMLKETGHTCEMYNCDSTDVHYVEEVGYWLCEKCYRERQNDI